MDTVLKPINRTTWGSPSPEEKEHDDIARAHFLKYCDTGKCIREKAGLKNGKTWHEGPCTECNFNPYIMLKQNIAGMQRPAFR